MTILRGFEMEEKDNNASWREEYECFHCGEKFYSEIQATYSQDKCGKTLCDGCEDLEIRN